MTAQLHQDHEPVCADDLVATDDQTLIGSLDPDLVARMARNAPRIGTVAKALGAAATAPVLLAAASTEANAIFGLGPLLPRQIVDTLNFALALERLEDGFYRQALASPGLIPPQFQAVFQQISRHESQHVSSLSLVLGISASAPSQFDYTGGGRYPDVFANFRTFAALSQTFEDLGVKAYKGQAGNLMGNDLILTTALRIHSVEARHAAEVRRVRGIRAWDGGAFDPALSKAQVLAMAGPFIVG